MRLLSPLMLVGLLAAGVPVLIHLVGRRRAPRLRFAALDFVLKSNRRLARRLRVRQLALLAARIALVAGIALMMAKPVVEVESDLPAVGSGAQCAVLIIDATMSMRWQRGRTSLLGVARRRALELARMLGGRAEIAVLSLSRPSGPLARLSSDLRLVRRAIDEIKPGYDHASASKALVAAKLILEQSSYPPRARHLFVLSDFAAHGWNAGEARQLGEVRLHQIDVAKGISRDNRAVVALEASPSRAPGQHSTQITTRICNYAAAAAKLLVDLSIDGRRVVRGGMSLETGACGEKTFQHTFGRGGQHEAVVSIAETDPLAADDKRYLRVDVQNDIRVLLVNGSPSPIRHRDELFYLETAFSAPVGGRRIVAATRGVNDLGHTRFDAYDVVALCNVRQLSPRRVGELERFVSKGGGLLVSVGDQVSAKAFNSAFGRLLPRQLRGAASAATGLSDSALRLGQVDEAHPVFASLPDEGGQGLRSARFTRVYRLHPAVSAGAERVLLRFDDGSPALIERRRGSGRVLLLATTLDRDWTDLPIRPGYLPLVRRMVRYLGRQLYLVAPKSEVVGTSRLIEIPASVRQLRLAGPGGGERLWSVEALASRSAVEVKVVEPGLYRTTALMADGVVRPVPNGSFAANPDPRESNLRRAAAVEQSPSRGTDARAVRKVELWHAFGGLLLLLLLCEAVLSRRG